MRNFKRLPPAHPPMAPVVGVGLQEPVYRFEVSDEGVTLHGIQYPDDGSWLGRSGKAGYHPTRPHRIHKAGRT